MTDRPLPHRELPPVLLEGSDPAVWAMCRRELLREDVPADDALTSPVVGGLLAGILDDGARRKPYRKWTGAHWRLVSLVELGLPAGHRVGVAACDSVLDHWAGVRRLSEVPVVNGRARRCVSQEGNAVAVACRLGLAADSRVTTLADRLIDWQWPDGGWNCDRRPEATHSSLHETLPALWGLHEYAAATGDPRGREAVESAADLLLRREVAYATSTNQPIHADFCVPHYPPYWRYDVLQALLILQRAGFGNDPRADRARGLVRQRRRADGSWRATRRWWRPPGSHGSGVEAVDWQGVADQMITLNALRVGADR